MTPMWIDPTMLGAVGDGVTDCTAAFNAAFAALPAGGGQIRIPPGKYRINSPLAFSYPSGRFSVSIVGAGADATTLFWPANGGLALQLSDPHHSVHVRDLAFTSGSPLSGVGFSATQSKGLGDFAQSDFCRVTFREDDSAPGAQWFGGINLTNVSNVSYDTCLFYNGEFGIEVQGSSQTQQAIVHNVSKCGFFGNGIGFLYGTYSQGVTISQCNFTNGVTGVYVAPSEQSATQLSISDCQFNVTANQILIESPIAELMIRGNLFYVPSTGNAIAITSSGIQATITGNCFSAITNGQGTGILVAGQFVNGVIGNNVFSYLNMAIDLAGSSSGWTVANDNFQGCVTIVASPGKNSVGVAAA